MRIQYYCERKATTFPEFYGKMVLNRIGQADTFCLRGAGQRVRQDADRPGGEQIKAERATPRWLQPMAGLQATIRKQS